MNLFWTLTVLMSLLALAFVLPPLWPGRNPADADKRLHALQQAHAAGVLDDTEFAAKRAALAQAVGVKPVAGSRPWIAATALALTIPAAAWLMYCQLGEPDALDAALRAPNATATTPSDADQAPPPDMDQAVSGLAKRLREQPDDLDGWMLLGRAYKSMERFEPAREALANAYRLAPEEPDIMVEYAEALALATPDRRFAGQSLALLQDAVERVPDHQRGLWLLGIAAAQAGETEAAVSHWEHLMSLLPDDADARDSLQAQIDGARERAGLDAPELEPAAAAATDTASSATPNADAPALSGPRLTVQVDIAPALKAQLDPSAVLFVYARAPSGPRMPVAIQRLSAGQLPVTVVLDDASSMMPQLKLSTLPEVVVGARISKSGQAMPQPGDLETFSATIDSHRSEPLNLIIDRVVE